jgi:cell division cycle 20-like protein 1 (cofactor of APC complex)
MEENEQCLRGREIKEEKMTVDQMYRCVLLDKNTSKMFNFGGSYSDKSNLSLSDKVGQKAEPKFFKEENNLIESKFQKRQLDPEYRKISKIPFKVLDAPNLQDDFYLNLLEWSSQNILSVALDTCLYFWNANNNRVLKFCDLAPDSISSLNWNSQGTQIAIGTSKGTIEMWDVTKSCRVNEYSGHSARVSSVAWGDSILASGSRDRSIKMRDIR